MPGPGLAGKPVPTGAAQHLGQRARSGAPQAARQSQPLTTHLLSRTPGDNSSKTSALHLGGPQGTEPVAHSGLRGAHTPKQPGHRLCASRTAPAPRRTPRGRRRPAGAVAHRTRGLQPSRRTARAPRPGVATCSPRASAGRPPFWFDPGRRLTSHGDAAPCHRQATMHAPRHKARGQPPASLPLRGGGRSTPGLSCPSPSLPSRPEPPAAARTPAPTADALAGAGCRTLPTTEVGPSHSAPRPPRPRGQCQEGQCPRGLVTPALWLSVPPAQVQLLPSQDPNQTPQVPQRPSPPSPPAASRCPAPGRWGPWALAPCPLRSGPAATTQVHV